MSKFSMVRGLTAFILAGAVLSACLPKQPRIGGIVKGVVYGDLNGNGTIEAGEGPLAGATVSLSDCGAIVSQVSAADGSFNFTNLPEGTCHVTAAKPGWTFSGSFPSLGYPLPVASNPDLPTAFSLFLMPSGGGATPVPAATDTTAPLSASDTPASPTEAPTDTLEATASVPSEAMLTPSGKDVNCRYGDGTQYAAIGFLRAGQTVPIHGTNGPHSWWQIQNPQDIAGHYCWVSGAAINTIGDISQIKVMPIPLPFVTAVSVSVSPGATVHGTCGGPNPVSFSVSITTNGPTTVGYYIQIFNSDNTNRTPQLPGTLTFATASTQTFDPGGAYHTDCGSFYIKAVVTSPNNISAQANWQVVSP